MGADVGAVHVVGAAAAGGEVSAVGADILECGEENLGWLFIAWPWWLERALRD